MEGEDGEEGTDLLFSTSRGVGWGGVKSHGSMVPTVEEKRKR